MQVRVLLFAGLKEAVGNKQLGLEFEAGTALGELLMRLERDYPAIAAYRGRLLVSLNEAHADMGATLQDGDEIALLPPMSGGSGRPSVQSRPLSMDALLAEVTGPELGGIVTFTGVVRNHSRHQTIEHLEYEAYVPMAEKQMQAILAQVRERWPQVHLALSHRIGRLEIGEAAVMMAAAAPHRAAAFEACRFAIDTLKHSVPIWKKEFAEDGAYWVEENP